MSRVYLAGPISGLTHTEASDWRDRVALRLEVLNIECFSPMRYTDNLKDIGPIEANAEYKENPMTSAKGIMSRDFFDVKRADLLLVYLKGATRISIGTVMEIGWAWHMQKPVIVVAEPDNVHVTHAMMQEAISIVVPTLEQGIHVVAAYTRNHVGG